MESVALVGLRAGRVTRQLHGSGRLFGDDDLAGQAQVWPDVHELAELDLLPSRVVVGSLARDHDDRVCDLGLGVQVQGARDVVLHQWVTVRLAVQQPQRVVLGVAEGPQMAGFAEKKLRL